MKSTTYILRIIAVTVVFFNTCIMAFAQSPYAMFGDNSVMLEAKKVPVSNICRVQVHGNNDSVYTADFQLNKGIVILSDMDGNVIRQDSISENSKARFITMDPHAENYYHLSPYSYCGGNPINAIDPDGMDWYKNNQTSYYTWFNSDAAIDGFTHIGGKGSVLGEFEEIIDNVLCGKDGLGMESLYSNGFTFDIAPTDKGGLMGSQERDWNLFDEFVNGTGPEFSVFLENHPYTEAVMSEDFVKNNQNVIRSRGRNGKYTNVGRPEFFPWQASPLSPMQFIGTYRYDGYSSKNDLYINNVVTDSKSVTSLGYHIPFLNNHRRSQRRAFGNTYQFYIKRTRK